MESSLSWKPKWTKYLGFGLTIPPLDYLTVWWSGEGSNCKTIAEAVSRVSSIVDGCSLVTNG